jgi:predicted nucleic acid-binding protein
VAYSKKSDWLKQYADPFFRLLKEEKMVAKTSSASLIELYYVLEDFGLDKAAVLGKQAEIAGIKGLSILPLTTEVILAAQAVMKSFKVTGLFDALYAATALNQDDERTILSTDRVYDRVAGIRRIDPRDFRP